MVWPKFKNKLDSDTFANVAEDLRKRAQLLPFEATVTSTIRTPEYNKSVGGVANSQHLTGGALDYRIRDLPPAKVNLIKKHFTDAGFHVINEGDHLHIQHANGGVATNANAPIQDMNKLQPLSGMSGRGPLRQGYKTAQLSDAMFPDLGGFGLTAMRGAGMGMAQMLNTGIEGAAFFNPMNQGAMLSRALGIPGNNPINAQQEILNNLFKSTLKKAAGTDVALASQPTQFELQNKDPLLSIGGHTILPSAGDIALGAGEYLPEMLMTAYGAGPAASSYVASKLPVTTAPAVSKSLSSAAATSAGAFTGGMLKGEPEEAYINALTFPAMQLGMQGAASYAKPALKYLQETPFLKNERGTIGAPPKGGLPGETTTGQIIGPDDAKSAVPRATVPEASSTLLAQIESAKAGLSKAVLITPGEVVPTIPNGLVTEATSAGTFIFDPAKISKQTIQRKVKNGSFGELLGHVEPKSATTTQAVAAIHPVTGTELKTSMVSPQNIAKQSEVLQSQFPQAQVVSGGPELAGKVLQQRQLATTPPIGGGTPPPSSGGSIPPIEPEIPGNLNFINKMVGPDGAPIPEAQRSELINVATKFAGEVEKQKRGVRTWAQTSEAAKELLSDPHQTTVKKFVNAKPGTAFNAEEIEAGISALTHYSNKIAELRNKVALDPNDLDLKEALKQNMSMLSQLQPNVMSGATEVGRGLNIFKKLKQAIDPVEAIRWKVLQGLSPDQVDLLAIKLAAAGDNPAKQMKVLADFAHKSWLDKWIEYSTAVKLYSPTTYEVNFTSNLANGMLRPVERLAASGFNAAESTLKSKPQTMFAQASLADAYGMARAVPRAIGNFLKALGDEDFKLGEQRASEAVFGHAIKGVKGQIIRMSFRFLNAADAFQRTINASGELAYQASNEGLKRGLKGQALTQFIDNFIQNPPKGFQDKANDVASEYLLQSELGETGKAVSNMLNSKGGKVFKLVLPYFKTPVNDKKFGMQRSLLSFLSPRNLKDLAGTPEQRALSAARIAIGGVVGMSTVAYALAGNITGEKPKSQAEQNQWDREGKVPNAIKLGDRWYPFKRFGSLAVNLTIAASIADSWDRRGELPTSEMITNMVGSIAKQAVEMPYLTGIKQLMEAMSRGGTAANNMASGFIGGQIPSIIGHTARAIDPIQRDPETISDKLKANIPFISESVAPQLDELGQEVQRPGSVLSRFFGLSVSKQKDDSQLGKMLNDLGVGKTALFGRSPMGVKLPQDIYVKAQKQYGDKAKQVLETIADSKATTVNDFLKSLSPEKAQFYYNFIPSSVSKKRSFTGKQSDYEYSDFLYSKQGMRDFVQGVIVSAGKSAADAALRDYLPKSAPHIQRQFLIDQLKSEGPAMKDWKVKELKDKGLFTPEMQKAVNEWRQ